MPVTKETSNMVGKTLKTSADRTKLMPLNERERKEQSVDYVPM